MAQLYRENDIVMFFQKNYSCYISKEDINRFLNKINDDNLYTEKDIDDIKKKFLEYSDCYKDILDSIQRAKGHNPLMTEYHEVLKLANMDLSESKKIYIDSFISAINLTISNKIISNNDEFKLMSLIVNYLNKIKEKEEDSVKERNTLKAHSIEGMFIIGNGYDIAESEE